MYSVHNGNIFTLLCIIEWGEYWYIVGFNRTNLFFTGFYPGVLNYCYCEYLIWYTVLNCGLQDLSTHIFNHIWTMDINSWVFKAESMTLNGKGWKYQQSKKKMDSRENGHNLIWYNCSTIVSQISISETSINVIIIWHTQHRNRDNIRKVTIQLIRLSTDDTLYVLWYKSSKVLF